MTTAIVLLLVTLALSAFFSGIEFAYVSANKLKVELIKQKEGYIASTLGKFFDQPGRFLGTTLLGNNLALVIFGIASAELIHHIFPTISNDFLRLMVETVITTIIILVFGEFLPKSLLRLNPSGALKLMSAPFDIVFRLFYLPVRFIVWLTNKIIRLFFKGDDIENEALFGKVDLEKYIKNLFSEDDDEEVDTALFEKALYLEDIKVRECMIPRNEVEAIEETEDIATLKDRFIDSGFSKILTFNGHIDNVTGFVYHQSILKRPKSIKQIINPISIVPETMSALDLLDLFTEENKSISKVVDEFGGTAGIVCLEDVLEEIFGEIIDEHDEQEFIERQISDNEFILSGRLEVDYLNEKYKLNIPDGEYETLAGYMFELFEKVPDRDEVLSSEEFEFTIISAGDTKIETVKLKKLAESEDE